MPSTGKMLIRQTYNDYVYLATALFKIIANAVVDQAFRIVALL